MMELIDNDIIVKIRTGHAAKIPGMKGLYRHEQMINALGLETSYKQIAKILVFQYPAKTGDTLLQNLFPMSDEQKAVWGPWVCFATLLIVKGLRLFHVWGSYPFIQPPIGHFII